MDEIVLRGMARWPQVPAVHGWLSLDRRGRWLLRGETIGNQATIDFINRNYARDDSGCWFFQNGPQRVFVTLGYTPLVYSLEPDGALRSHTGRQVRRVDRALLDDKGNVLLNTALGPGLVAASDLLPLAEGLCDGDGRLLDDEEVEAAVQHLDNSGDTSLWLKLGGGTPVAVERVREADAPVTLGFVREPQPVDGDEQCRP